MSQSPIAILAALLVGAALPAFVAAQASECPFSDPANVNFASVAQPAFDSTFVVMGQCFAASHTSHNYHGSCSEEPQMLASLPPQYNWMVSGNKACCHSQNCNYGPLLSDMGPGAYALAITDYTGEGFGFRNSAACGECYQITGPVGSIIGVVDGSCPDCSSGCANNDWRQCGATNVVNTMPHFDTAREAMIALIGGPLTGVGRIVSSMRKVSCPWAGNVMARFQPDVPNQGASYVVMFLGHHRVGLDMFIKVQETGSSSWTTVPRADYNAFAWHPSGAGAFPIQIQVYSKYGDVLQWTLKLSDVVPGNIIDTGVQFSHPAPGQRGASACSACAPPPILPWNPVIFDDVLWPGRTQGAIPIPYQEWESYNGFDDLPGAWDWTWSSNCHAGSRCGRLQNSVAWSAVINIGSNFFAPRAMITSIDLWIRPSIDIQFIFILSGSTAPSVQLGIAQSGPQLRLPSLTTYYPANTWSLISIPIAADNTLPPFIGGFLLQQERVLLPELLVDDFRVVLATQTGCNVPPSPWWTLPPCNAGTGLQTNCNPTCSDGYMNADEAGIDCGGWCPTTCGGTAPSHTPSLSLSHTRTHSISHAALLNTPSPTSSVSSTPTRSGTATPSPQSHSRSRSLSQTRSASLRSRSATKTRSRSLSKSASVSRTRSRSRT